MQNDEKITESTVENTKNNTTKATRLSSNELLLKWLWFFEELFKKWKVDEDCQQMIYIDFLQYDNVKLNQIDEQGDMKFWIVRFIKNYWFSKTSRYYATYKRYYEWFEELPDD